MAHLNDRFKASNSSRRGTATGRPQLPGRRHRPAGMLRITVGRWPPARHPTRLPTQGRMPARSGRLLTTGLRQQIGATRRMAATEYGGLELPHG